MASPVFHLSGQASLAAVKELLTMIPCTVVVADAESGEILAVSPQAQQLIGIDPDRLQITTDFLVDKEARDERIRLGAKLPEGAVIQLKLRLRHSSGREFDAAGSMMTTRMAGRKVYVSTFLPTDLPTRTSDAIIS